MSIRQHTAAYVSIRQHTHTHENEAIEHLLLLHTRIRTVSAPPTSCPLPADPPEAALPQGSDNVKKISSAVSKDHQFKLVALKYYKMEAPAAPDSRGAVTRNVSIRRVSKMEAPAAPDSMERISFLLLFGEPETVRIAVVCFSFSAAPDSIERISFLLLLGEPETARIAVILYPSPGSGNRFPEPLLCRPALPPPPSVVL